MRLPPTTLVRDPAARPTATARLLGRSSPLRRLDWTLLGSVLALGLTGALLSWAATTHLQADIGGDPQLYLKRSLLNLAIGVALLGTVTTLDYRHLRAYAPILYGAGLLLLATVLTPLASTINGAHSWIVFGGGFSLQPSEFTKLTVIVMLSALLAEAADTRDGTAPTRRQFLTALAVVALPAAVIMSIPELGTSMVLAAITAGILFAAGIPARWLILLGTIATAAATAAVTLHLLSAYQLNRFTAFADPSLDPTGVGYNTNQARIAIGAGGILGQGLFHGTQTNAHYVPEQQTDFIFTVAGEELGFVGAAAIIAVVGVLLWRAVRIARRADTMFATLLATGVTAWLAFQSFENIGMTLGIMPVAGIPLPFVSYGGSSMFATCIAVGLLQSIRVRSSRAAGAIGG